MRSEYFLEFYIDGDRYVTINEGASLGDQCASLWYKNFYIYFWKGEARLFHRVGHRFIMARPYEIYKQIEKGQKIYKVYHNYTGRYEI